MQKKAKSKRNSKSVVFIISCILICGLSLTYFFVNLNKTTVRNENEIANIIFKKKIAQRKFSDSVTWERLQNGSPLYSEDIIRTDSEALADIVFTKKPVKLNLDENTMLQILESKEGNLKLNVSGGSFSIDTSEAQEAITIDLGNGNILNVEHGTKMSANSGMDKNGFVIHEGSAVITNADGTEEVFLEGDSIKIDDNGNLKQFPVAVTNLNTTQKILTFESDVPSNVEDNDSAETGAETGVESGTVKAGNTVRLELKKTADTQNEKIIVETSTDEKFTNIIERKEITDSSVNEVEINAEHPVVFYRVYSEEKEEDAYEGKIVVEKVMKPKLISPRNGAVFASVNGIPDINFKWNCGDFCDFSRVEVFNTEDMSKTVLTQDIKGNSFTANRFEAGKYKWRITPHYSVEDKGFGEQTEFNSFEVVKEELKVRPVLSLPRQDTVVSLDNESKDIIFMWKSDIKSSTYMLEISDDENFSNVIYENQISMMRDVVPFALSSMPENKYFWRVTRIDEKNIRYTSDPRSFDIKKYVPSNTELVLPLENFSAETDVVSASQFLWKLSDKYDRAKTQSIFEIASDANFDNIVKTVKTDKTSLTGISLDKGTYFWRVAAVNKEDGFELIKTTYRKFVVLDKLEKPLIEIPSDNSVYNIFDAKTMKISWNNVKDAEYYKVKIYDKETKELVSQVENLKESQVNVSLENVAADKKYICAVTAFTEEKDNSPQRISKTSSVNVSFENIQKIALSLPSNGSKIPGLGALRDGVLFKWNPGKDAKNAQFVLTRVYSNGTSKEVFTSRNDKGQLTVRKLTEGTYRWTVKAQSANGTSLTPNISYSFTVLKTEPLESPVLQVPSNEFVIDSVYLRNNRKINFEWSEVDGATDYLFVLYQVNENGSRRKIAQKKTSGTKVVFSDLKSLDVGQFEWHITAFSHLRDGFEEQRSAEIESRFSIDFGLPATVETIDPGRMYGE